MAGGVFSEANLYGMTIRESATDGSDFANAPADYRRLFLGEDGALHLKDSAGTVTDVGGGGVATDTIFDAKGDLPVGTGANTASKLAAGTNGYILSAASGEATGLLWVAKTTVFDPDVHMPRNFLILPAVQPPIANTNWTTRSAQGAQNITFGILTTENEANPTRLNGLVSSGAQNDAAAWDIPMAAGTWTVELFGRKFAASGIYTVQEDGVDKGTVDGYGAAEAAFSGTVSWSVATTGLKRINIIMKTKHASSSNYYGALHTIAIYRTA